MYFFVSNFFHLTIAMRFIHVIVFILPPFIYLLSVCVLSAGAWFGMCKSRAVRLRKKRLEEDEKRCWEIHYCAVMLQHRLWRDTAHHCICPYATLCLRPVHERKEGEGICLPRSFPALDFHSVRVCTIASHLSLTDRRNEVKTKCRSNHWRTKLKYRKHRIVVTKKGK